MTFISSVKDPEALSLIIVNEFDADVERVWQIWEDPRQLERWWGPPSWPATFTEFDFTVGGLAHYYMTGPEGEKAGGWWKFALIEGPTTLEIEDGFADEDGHPVDELGVTGMRMTLEDIGGRTRMTITSRFESAEQLQKMVEMGMEEGMKEAASQIDAILAE